MPDNRTPSGWPLPHPSNRAADDAARIAEALTAADQAVTTAQASLTAVAGDVAALGASLGVSIGEVEAAAVALAAENETAIAGVDQRLAALARVVRLERLLGEPLL